MTLVKRIHPVKGRGRRRLDLSTPLLLAPYATLFLFFIALPVFVAFLLSFTYFNAVEMPQFNGLTNYIEIVTQDDIFMRYVLPNTLIFSVIVGPIGYVLQFLLAWLLTQIPKVYRTVFALIFYSPSMTTGITMSVMWKVIFSGDQYGYLNNLLMSAGILEAPVNWLADANYIMPIMILVTLWGSMGVGFLAMMSGILNTDPQLYEAGYIDGVSNRFQEIVYITIPSMKPQMLFGAVMAIVNTFSAGQIGVDLTGANPTPSYAGQTMINHINDHGFIQYSMGYAAALSVVLLLLILAISQIANRLFSEKEDG